MTTPEKPKRPEQFAQPQAPVTIKPVTIKELYNERATYENFPIYQRNKVWPLKYNQWEINSILAGKSLPSLIAYREIDVHGKQSYWFTDGRQRLSAILDFRDNKFKTWTAMQKEQAEPNSVAPIEPGRYYEELSPLAKMYFHEYVLSIIVEPKRSDAEQREQFRGYQNHIALTAAEKIDSYLSRAKDAAMRIEQHIFWEDFYFGQGRNQKKIFQSSLYLLALELAPDGVANLGSTTFMHLLASGKRDAEITEHVMERVFQRIELMSYLFSGTQFTIRACAIVMYQSVLYLERQGIAIQATRKGCLSKWLRGVVDESNRADNMVGYQRPLQQMVRKPVQYAFWERHGATVLALVKEAR